MRTLFAFAALLVALPSHAQTVETLHTADAAQHAAAARNDGPALAEMADPNFRLFAPEGYIGDRNRLIARFKSGETGYVRFERTLESTTVTGDVGIVMGREVIARKGQKPIGRRFTNVWLWKAGRWWWLARHANQANERIDK